MNSELRGLPPLVRLPLPWAVKSARSFIAASAKAVLMGADPDTQLDLRLVLARDLGARPFGRLLVGNRFVELGPQRPAIPLAIFLGQIALCDDQQHAMPGVRFEGDTSPAGRLYRAFSLQTWPRWAEPLQELRSEGLWPPWRLERGWLRPKARTLLHMDGVCRTMDQWLGFRDDERIVKVDLWKTLLELVQKANWSLDALDPRLREEYAGNVIQAEVLSRPESAKEESSPAVGAEPSHRDGWHGPVDRALQMTIDIASDGGAIHTFTHHLQNLGTTALTRLVRELWFEQTTGPLTIAATDECSRKVIIQRIHDAGAMVKFACQMFPALEPGASMVLSYRCGGGRFVRDHYWRQSFVRPTDTFSLELRQRGVSGLQQCSLSRERPDGSEVLATDAVEWETNGDQLTIRVRQQHLVVGEAITLRWGVDHARP